jgi:hypothetical protein
MNLKTKEIEYMTHEEAKRLKTHLLTKQVFKPMKMIRLKDTLKVEEKQAENKP